MSIAVEKPEVTAAPPNGTHGPDTILEVAPAPVAPSGPRDLHAEMAPLPLLHSAVAVLLGITGAAWMVGGVFSDSLVARGLAVLGGLLGVGLAALAHRSHSLSFAQFLALPLGVLAGAVVTIPYATGGTASLPSLVIEAVRSGGLLQAPVPFDPGWRFLVVVVFVVVSAGALSIALSTRRAVLGVALTAPLTVAAGLIQPHDSVVIDASVAVLLIVAGLSIARGAELGRDTAVSAGFELRRLGRSAGLAVLLIAALVGVSQVGFLLPEPARTAVVPPTKPQVPPPLPDVELFQVREPLPVPLRLGDLDVYDASQNAWLLPPYDPSQNEPVSSSTVPGAAVKGAPVAVTITVGEEPGHTLPSVANPQRISGLSGTIEYEPRNQTLSLASRLATGMQYTVIGPAAPTGAQLAAAPQAPAPLVSAFTGAPKPPDAVHLLLLRAPANLWDRLQYLRTQLYAHVVAKGSGLPVDITPSRVVQMLGGATASPYEITAAEVLLARWAGVPARIGYGYYGGTKLASGAYSIHPDNGSTWLEAYFQGYGWVPIVGVPAHAQPSTSQNQKNQQPEIRPTGDLALVVYEAVSAPVYLLAYEVVRYWLVIIVPIIVGIALLVMGYPALVKTLRRVHRRRWAAARGPRARVAVAYCEFRDIAHDLRVGDGSASPLLFLSSLHPDVQHEELAWLVSRGMWGDLRRDLRDDDADAAERLSALLAWRLRRGQPALYTVLAHISRASLRAPYSDEIPNTWWPPKQAGRPRLWWLRLHAPLLRVRLSGAATLAAAGAIAALLLNAFGGATTAKAHTFPQRIVPAQIGVLTFHMEPSASKALTSTPNTLVQTGRVYTIHDSRDGFAVGSVQISMLKPAVSIDDQLVKDFQQTLAVGRFRRVELPGQRAYERFLDSQSMFFWFRPDDGVMVLLVTVQPFDQSTSAQLLRSLVAYEQGGRFSPVTPAVPK